MEVGGAPLSREPAVCLCHPPQLGALHGVSCCTREVLSRCPGLATNSSGLRQHSADQPCLGSFQGPLSVDTTPRS